MITLRRLDLVRQESSATADELASLVTQLNAQLDPLRARLDAVPLLHTEILTTVGPAGTAEAPPVTPSGYIEFDIGGTAYVLPIYLKG